MEEEESEGNMGNVDDSDAEWSDCNTDTEEDSGGKGEPEKSREKTPEVPEDDEDEDESSLKIDLDATPSTSTSAVKKMSPPKGPKLKVIKPGMKRKGKLTRANKARSRGTLAAPGSEPAKRRRKKRQRLLPTEAVPKSVVEAAAADNPDLDANIDASAAKLGLNRTQVKVVLKQMLQSPDLLNVFMEKAGEGASPADKFKMEPRITRKTKEKIKEDGGRLDWVLEKIEAMNNPKTPAKKGSGGDKNDEHLSLLPEAELPEEDPDDDEYDPKKDPEADVAGSDDEESLMTNSEVGTPRTLTSNLFSSPPSSASQFVTEATGGDMLETPRMAATPVSSTSNVASSAARNLSFDCPPPPPPPQGGLVGGSSDPNLGRYHNKQQQQKETRQTRSRSNLKDVPIEQLENQFVPPDITPDMYNMEVDDYALFLADTYSKPIQESENPRAEDNQETPREDAEEADPEWEWQQDQDMLLETPDEVQWDRSTKVPGKELDDLLSDAIRAYNLDACEESKGNNQAKDTTEKGTRVKKKDPKELLDEYYKEMAVVQEPPQFTQEQHWALNHQIRQHIQLLTSMTMLTSGYSNASEDDQELRYVNKLNANCKEMMSQMYSDVLAKQPTNPIPVLSQPTLLPSFRVTDEWERCGRRATDHDTVPKSLKPKQAQKPTAANRSQLTEDFKDFVGGCVGVFPYPQLLPPVGLNLSLDGGAGWTSGEDRLILLAFDSLGVTTSMTNYLSRHAAAIHKDYVVAKSVQQIRKHVSNIRTRAKKNTENHPINLFFDHQILEKEDLTYASWHQLGPGQATREAAPDSLPEVYLKHWSPGLFDSKRAAAKGKVAAVPVVQQEGNAEFHIEKPGFPAAVFEYSHVGGGAVSMTIPEGEHVVVSTIDLSEETINKAAEAAAGAPLPSVKKRSKKSFLSPSKATSDRIVKKYKKQRKKSGRTAVGGTTPDRKTPSPTPLGEVDSPSSPSAVQATILEAAIEESGIEGEGMETAAALVSSPTPKTAAAAVSVEGARETAAVVQGANMDLLAAFERVTAAPIQTEGQKATKMTSRQHRKTKVQREAEQTVYMLEPETVAEKAARVQREAEEVFKAAERALQVERAFVKFLEAAMEFEREPAKAFAAMHSLCSGKVWLQEMLLDLLRPEHAVSIGAPVYDQFRFRQTHKDFFRKLRRFYEFQVIN